ncbi:MAG TPA: hypothetical protein VFG51_01385 [Candidatus Saccharimonadia bacterium]|nr:hypothetical protein [Candidatus Saccharimonadia bacterium]
MDTQAAQTAPSQDDAVVSAVSNVSTDQSNIQTTVVADDAQTSQQDPLNAVASAVPQVLNDQVNASLNPANATSARGAAAKEVAAAGLLETIANEVPGAQAVEHERTPEISPEVEAWVEQIHDEANKTPEKIVVADSTVNNLTGNYAAEPIVVLPLTKPGIQQGMKHPVTDSVKWLAVWCLRVIKKFHGSVVYRPVHEQPKVGN